MKIDEDSRQEAVERTNELQKKHSPFIQIDRHPRKEAFVFRIDCDRVDVNKCMSMHRAM